MRILAILELTMDPFLNTSDGDDFNFCLGSKNGDQWVVKSRFHEKSSWRWCRMSSSPQWTWSISIFARCKCTVLDAECDGGRSEMWEAVDVNEMEHSLLNSRWVFENPNVIIWSRVFAKYHKIITKAKKIEKCMSSLIISNPMIHAISTQPSIVNSTHASVSHLVRKLLHGPAPTNPDMTTSWSRSIKPCRWAKSCRELVASREGNSRRSAAIPLIILKSAELSRAIAQRRSALLLSLEQIRTVTSARSGRRSMPPFRSAQIGSTWVMLKSRECIRPRVLNAISLAENMRTPCSWATTSVAPIRPLKISKLLQTKY